MMSKKHYKLILSIASIGFVIVALMGPITNILLSMGEQKILGYISFGSSILGIPLMYYISKFYGFEGFLLSSSLSAMFSNIASRIFLGRLSNNKRS